MHRLAVLSLITLAITGCDVARHGTQRIEVTVTSQPSGLPLADARVRTTPAERFPKSSLDKLAGDSFRPSNLDVNRVSDETGRVVFKQPVSALKSGPLVWFRIDPIKLRDGVTGRDFWFRIERDTIEYLRVNMKPGNTVHGEQFGLGVNAIGQPVATGRSD